MTGGGEPPAAKDAPRQPVQTTANRTPSFSRSLDNMAVCAKISSVLQKGARVSHAWCSEIGHAEGMVVRLYQPRCKMFIETSAGTFVVYGA